MSGDVFGRHPELVDALVSRGVPRGTAHRLTRRFQPAHILRQMGYYDFEVHVLKMGTDGGGGWLKTRIEEDWPAPTRSRGTA